MIFWGRVPMVLVLVLGGFAVYVFAKKFFSQKAALLSLILYSLSPTLIAHGRLVTTDVGITVAFLVFIYFFLSFLKSPNWKNILFSGLALGGAQITKFTGVLLIPYSIIIFLLWVFFQKQEGKSRSKCFWFYGFRFLIILVIAFLVIYLFYLPHVWNYPKERQARDISLVLSSHPFKFLGPLLSRFSLIGLARPLVQYLYGLSMVLQRGVGGNTTYFLGEVSAEGWRNYFPLLYLLKVPIAFHVLTICAVAFFLVSKRKPKFPEVSLFVFIAIYWGITLLGSLNIGIRHLLPIFPLTIILVANEISKKLTAPWLRTKYGLLSLLLFWQAISVFSHFPHFIPYYNEFAGGPDKGYVYAVDSNLDWGQDLKRLEKWIGENNVEKIYLHYFGGADTDYYLGDKFEPWWETRSPEEIKRPAYLAVSATILQGGQAIPGAGFSSQTDYYNWLNREELVGKAGYSIFIYYLK